MFLLAGSLPSACAPKWLQWSSRWRSRSAWSYSLFPFCVTCITMPTQLLWSKRCASNSFPNIHPRISSSSYSIPWLNCRWQRSSTSPIRWRCCSPTCRILGNAFATAFFGRCYRWPRKELIYGPEELYRASSLRQWFASNIQSNTNFIQMNKLQIHPQRHRQWTKSHPFRRSNAHRLSSHL